MADRTGSILGTRVLRTEDPKFLTTGGVYTDDLDDERLTGAGWVSFVRSPVAHARITGIDTAAARAMPGVLAVFTGEDIPENIRSIRPMRGMNRAMVQYLLAIDEVRFVGEPVAAVVTERRDQGEDAIELVEVDYDTLPAVVTIADALADKEFAHSGLDTNVVVEYGRDDPPDEHLFDDCEVVVTRDIVNQRLAPAPMEVRAAAAVWGEDERLTAWVPNQGAQGTKASLARQLRVDADRVRVITPDVGGAFGAKFGADPEVVVTAWIASEISRPARWTETRYENLLGMTHGRAQNQRVSIGGSRDGDIQAYRIEIGQDCGAYPRIGALLPSLTILMAPGTYKIDRVEAMATSVATNTTPIGAYRGAGRPEATAAIERAVDLFAAEIGMDPAEVRRRNVLEPFDEVHDNGFGAKYDSGDYAVALDKALAAAGYDDLRAEQARRREAGERMLLGIGLASYVEITGGGDESGDPNENATVEVHDDGSATVLTGTSPHGQGHATAWAMLVHDELGIPVDRITVTHGDTDLIPKGGGTGGSRSLQQGGAAVQQASRELSELALERAAERLEANVADLRLDKDSATIVVAGVPDSGVSLAELAEQERLFVHTTFSAPGATFPFGAHVAVVEVDADTGKATIERIVTVDDAGTILNPLLAEGQRHGGIAQGATQALYEEFVYDEDGNPLTASFAEYAFPAATELPSFELVDMATPTTYNPLGAKGIGEAGSIGATPAVQNAVVDAVAHLGVRHIDLPTTPLRVWRAINAARENN